MDPQLVTAIYEQNTSEIIALINSGRFNNELCVGFKTSSVYSIIFLICQNYESDDNDIGLICDALFALPSFDPGFTYMYDIENENICTYLMDACWSKNEYVAMRLIATGQANPSFTDNLKLGAMHIAFEKCQFRLLYIILTGDLENSEQNSQNSQIFELLVESTIFRHNCYYNNDKPKDAIINENVKISNSLQEIVAEIF